MLKVEDLTFQLDPQAPLRTTSDPKRPLMMSNPRRRKNRQFPQLPIRSHSRELQSNTKAHPKKWLKIIFLRGQFRSKTKTLTKMQTKKIPKKPRETNQEESSPFPKK